jgi:drug/metabolite transporter (DMT)-like permease
MSSKLLLLISVLFASVGQVLFKKGMSLVGALSFGGGIPGILKTVLGVVFSPVVFTGLIFYALSTLVWLFALSKTTLNYAYPFTALTFILVMLASYFIFSETLPLNRIIGVGVICLGVIIASFKLEIE